MVLVRFLRPLSYSLQPYFCHTTMSHHFLESRPLPIFNPPFISKTPSPPCCRADFHLPLFHFYEFHFFPFSFSCFINFCDYLGEKSITETVPILSQYGTILSFIVFKFLVHILAFWTCKLVVLVSSLKNNLIF